MNQRQENSRWRFIGGDDWQLGIEPRAEEASPPVRADSKIDFEAQPLDRIVQVITVEGLAWSAIALWTVVTRLVGLGIPPLAPSEARHALFEYDLVNRTNWASTIGYHPTAGAWIHLLEAALFATAGVNDLTARLGFAVTSLSVVAMMALMRRSLGRAGAIAAATMVAISPTFTFFSRSSSTGIVVAALAMLSLVSFIALMRKPSLPPSTCLGIAAGLLCGTAATGLATAAILTAALILLGVCQMVVSERPMLEFRIWLRRYRSNILIVCAVAVLTWLLPQAIFFKLTDIYENLRELSDGFSAHPYFRSLECYAPAMLLYEFLIVLAAILGLVTTLSRPPRSRVAFYSLGWMLLTLAIFMGNRAREPERLVILLLPMVMIGGLGINCLYRSGAWRYARLVLFVLGVITIYTQVLTSFVYPAPASGSASHANLYWRDGATTVEAREQLEAIRRRFPPQGGTIFMDRSRVPSLRWYLRDFRPSSSAKTADLSVYFTPPASLSNPDFDDIARIDLQTAWEPTLSTLNPVRALHFVFTARPWLELHTTTVSIVVHAPSDTGPTLIVPPN
jgi:hypothetical protein